MKGGGGRGETEEQQTYQFTQGYCSDSVTLLYLNCLRLYVYI